MFIPNHIHTSYSLLDGYIRSDKLIERLSDYNYHACTITDHGNISGCVEFSSSLDKAGFKPIIGCELYCTLGPATFKDKSSKNLHMVCLARNKQGFYDLCKIVSRSNQEDVFYRKPRVDLSILEELQTDNLIFFTGHPGSLLHHIITKDGELHPDALSLGIAFVNQMKAKLSHVVLESQRMYCSKEECDCIAEIGRKTNTKVVACIDAHYVDKTDALYQRILLCSTMNIKMQEWRAKAGSMSSFFQNNNYHIPNPQEMQSIFPSIEIQESLEIGDMCEKYSLVNKPTLPKFDCDSEEELLKQYCRDGWERIIHKRGIDSDIKQREKYAKRVLDELDVISTYDLSGYFLIVQDFINWVRSQNILCSVGRGSAAGSLVSYLLGITLVDPIPHNLLFSRFLNKGRFSGNNFEYPDIDVDLPTYIREDTIAYLRNKYGDDKVGQVATFGKLQGASAIKEVLRANDVCSFDELNRITKDIPQIGGIADQLEAQHETSVLRFTLNNSPSVLEEYCTIDDAGELHGDFAPYFQQAIELEGSLKTQGVHAAGVIISPTSLGEICPMLQNNVCGIDMDGLKKMGLVKFDLLGVAAYDKLEHVNKLLKENYV